MNNLLRAAVSAATLFCWPRLGVTQDSVLTLDQALARRSYEAGRMSLAEFLLLRRETLETHIAYLDRLLEAALAGIELEARAGVLP